MRHRVLSQLGRRLVTGLCLAAVGGALLAAPADAVLSRTVGDVDPSTGFPSWYADENGLALQLCFDDAQVICPTSRAELLDAGAEGEGFYSLATAEVGGFTAEYALEAAYADVGPGQETVFARTRYTGDGRPSSTYTFTGPFGTDSCTTDELGEMGGSSCTFDDGGLAGGDFTRVLGSSRMGPFLTWDTFGVDGLGAPPPGYVGDPAVPHAVTGSPTGYDAVRVTGPGITGDCPATGTQPAAGGCAETTSFLLAGRVADGPQGVTLPAAIDLGSVLGSRRRTVTHTNVGTSDLTVHAVDVVGDPALTLAATDCLGAPVPPGGSCTATVLLAPAPGRTATGRVVIGDDSQTGVRTVPLRARGAISDFGPMADVGLGTVELGRSAQARVPVTNTGDAPLALTRADLRPTGGAFTLAGAGARPCVVGTTVLQPGDTCGLRVTGAPSVVGESRAELVLAAADQVPVRRVPVIVTGSDTTAPRLLQRSPLPGTTGVARSTVVVVRFDEAVTGVGAGTFQLYDEAGGRAVGATRSSALGGTRWTLSPSAALRAGARYTVRLVGGRSGIQDANGVPATSVDWGFRVR